MNSSNGTSVAKVREAVEKCWHKSLTKKGRSRWKGRSHDRAELSALLI
ncbi:hypothetical protein [Microcoleus sp. AT9b-C5]